MAKLDTMSLDELYARKITASVEAAIMMKEDFSCKSQNWCDKVCRLNCKNPPSDRGLIPSQQVDVLIIQDYKAFAEPRFKRKSKDVEEQNRKVIGQIAGTAFKAKGDKPALTYALTSLLKCQLENADIKKNKAPTDTVITKCKPYLLAEIAARKPKVIISLNTSVTKALGLKKTNYGNRGEIFEGVVFTIHPRTLLMLRQNSSGKFWGPDFYKIILRDFCKAAAVARGELKNPDLAAAVEKYSKHVKIARSIEDVETFCATLTQAGLDNNILSYDTETNSLDPYAVGSKLITVQFGYRHPDGHVEALVFPMWHRENRYYDPDVAWPFICKILEDEDIGKVGHNVKFDILFTYCTTKCRIKGVRFDTMLLMHHLDSGIQGCLGLKGAVWDHLPGMELGGYENLLPPLTSKKKLGELDSEEGDGESSGETEGGNTDE